MNKINKNLILNGTRIFINLIFPLLTFPYLSHRLKPLGLGTIEFANSIINYLILFCSLGIPLYGLREIAFSRDSKIKTTNIFCELIIINLLMVVFGYITFFSYLYLTKNQNININVLKILSINIFFSVIGVEWFFQGIEEYSYITKRSIIFKIIALILIFIFVKQESDYIKYAYILVFGVSGSNLLNIIKVREFIDFKNMTIKNLQIKRHIKAIFKIFLMSIAGSIYLNLDSIMIGYMDGPIEVGMYTAATKMNRVVVGIIIGIISCLTPTISNLLENNQKEEYSRTVNYSLNLIGILVFPSLVGFYFCAEDILVLFSGLEYLPALKALKIMIPIILLVSLNNFIGLQILYPNKKENIVLKAIATGAIINLIINYILIPKYSYTGAAIATVIAELIILIILILLGKNYIKFIYYNKNIKKYIISSIIMGVILYFFKYYISLSWKIIFGAIIYLVVLILLKEELIAKIILNIKKKYKK